MPAADIAVHPNQYPRIVTHDGLALREDTVYTNHKGEEKSRIHKRADKALEKLRDALMKTLEPDEAILYVARAQAPASGFEQFAFGWYIYRVTAAVLVITNRRVLHFLTDEKGNWKRSLRSLRWGDVAEAQVKGWFGRRTLKLKYRSGKQESYWAIPGGDGKVLKVLLGGLLPGSVGENTPAQAIVSLCPDCRAILSPGIYQCTQCGLTFKDEKTMIRRSLLIPGGGYFYTGYWFLGVADFIVEASLLYLVLFYLLAALGIVQVRAEPGAPPYTAGVYLFVTGYFALLLAVEKLWTIYHCRRFIREYIPLKR